MFPEDRVLVAYLPDPADFEIIRDEGWYRIPESHAPKGLHAEYYAFYFGRRFGEDKWAIHYYARQQGFELLTRRDLLPEQADHPRAAERYYKVSLGPLQKVKQPIISLRWRRITFMHTTWDRFLDAREINDLFVEGGEYVDRLYATLKEGGYQPELNFDIREPDPDYKIIMTIPCHSGEVAVDEDQLRSEKFSPEELADAIKSEVERRGGQV
jgi:hypothetical protein